VHLRKKLPTCYITRHFLKSVSVSSTSRNVSLKALALFSPRESEEKNMGLNSKTFTILRVTTNKLSMIQNDHVSADKSRNLVSGVKTAFKSTQKL